MPVIQSSPASPAAGSRLPALGASPASPSQVPGLFQCKTLLAVIIFLLLNMWSAHSSWGHSSALNFPEKGWTGWAIEDYLQSNTSADLVFLGSSLMLVPIAGADADYLNRRLDGSQHHHSQYFEKQFQTHSGQAIRTFNFALPGQMPSDAYLVTRNILSRKTAPKVIVYGVGPRDFIDNTLPSPASTDPFHHLVRFGDISAIASRLMPQMQERFAFELGRLVNMYGIRIDLAHKCNLLASQFINNLLPLPNASKPYSIFERRQILPDYKAAELQLGEAYFRPTTAAEKTQCFDNLAEYRRRYQSVKWNTFTNQMEFLSDLLDLAKNKNTHVVMMLMPITDINRDLLKSYAWDAYRRSVKLLATVKGASFLDLAESGQFNLSDFGDTVHLHAGGGQKMLRLLSQSLAKNEAVHSALQRGKQQ